MELQSKLRSAGTELVKMIGRKLLSGNFNLATVSFPIKLMSHKSLLQTIPTFQCTFCYYLNYAATSDDPVIRFKAVIAATVAFMYEQRIFDKPLNPVLGETYVAKGADGSMIYME